MQPLLRTLCGAISVLMIWVVGYLFFVAPNGGRAVMVFGHGPWMVELEPAYGLGNINGVAVFIFYPIHAADRRCRQDMWTVSIPE